MNHTRLWVAAAIIAGIVIIGFMLSVPHTRDVPEASSPSATAASVPAVTIHDSFKKGTHTISGSVMAPDACAVVSAESTLEGDHILVSISMEDDAGVCLEVPTQETFQATLSAAANLPVMVTVNGSPATTSAP